MIRELIRSAFVIGRRDFVATVFSRSFLFFLIGPLFPIILVMTFGGIGARIAEQTERPVIAVVMGVDDYARLDTARGQLASAFDEAPVVRLARFDPMPDPDSFRARLLTSKKPPVLGVMDGSLAAPRFIGAVTAEGTTVRQLRLLIDDARRAQVVTAPAGQPLAVTLTGRSAGSLSTARALTARGGQAILFILTILLAGMLLSQLIEEKSNKVIEILAAAVPVDAIFVGKLFAMLAISLVGIMVWTLCGALAIATWSSGGLAAMSPPAVGWPLFVLLGLIYFAMAYLLIGSVFLAIGSQAASVREIQTLNMPVVLGQSMVYFLGASAVGHLDEPRGLVAGVFPLSSPFALIARAAEQPALWPHLVAIAWQLLWVVIILRAGAALFRRNVLKSGPSRRWWRSRQSAATLIVPNLP